MSLVKQDWYRVSFDLGIPQGAEFPKEWPGFFRWLTNSAEPLKTIGDLVVLPGLETRGPLIRMGERVWWCEEHSDTGGNTQCKFHFYVDRSKPCRMVERVLSPVGEE